MEYDFVRCFVVCEGQTEEKFVKETLYPYFMTSHIYLSPLIVKTSKGQKGGGINYDRVFRFVTEKIKEDREAFVTTMFDYYGLGKSLSNNVSYSNDIYKHIEDIQNAFDNDVKQKCDTDKFFTHIQPHEFESLLFTDITKIIEADAEWKHKKLDELKRIEEEYPNPEFINSSTETSPSHRLLKIFNSPKYNKVLHGNRIAARIGIENMRLKCKHFDGWCKKILLLNSQN